MGRSGAAPSYVRYFGEVLRFSLAFEDESLSEYLLNLYLARH